MKSKLNIRKTFWVSGRTNLKMKKRKHNQVPRGEPEMKSKLYEDLRILMGEIILNWFYWVTSIFKITMLIVFLYYFSLCPLIRYFYFYVWIHLKKC